MNTLAVGKKNLSHSLSSSPTKVSPTLTKGQLLCCFFILAGLAAVFYGGVYQYKTIALLSIAAGGGGLVVIATIAFYVLHLQKNGDFQERQVVQKSFNPTLGFGKKAERSTPTPRDCELYSYHNVPASVKLAKQLGFANRDKDKKIGIYDYGQQGLLIGYEFAPGAPLELAMPKEQLLKEYQIVNGDNYGVVSCENDRDYQEDNFVKLSFKIGKKAVEFYAVFDGHNDKQSASEFIKRDFVSYFQPLFKSDDLNDQVIADALMATFVQLGKEYAKAARVARQEGGTTATCAVFIDGKIYFPNVGDSRTILVKPKETYQLTEDADPGNPRFKRALEHLGRRFKDSNPNTDTASQDNMRDHYIRTRKEHNITEPWFQGQEPIVRVERCAVARDVGWDVLVPRPKITRVFQGAGRDKVAEGVIYAEKGNYLVLASDGYWCVATTNETGDLIRKLERLGYTPGEMAAYLTDAAITSGSSDNVTVMVIKI